MWNLDRIWARVSQRNDMRGKKLSDYVFQVVTEAWQLTSTQASQQTAITFSAGAVIMSVMAGADVNGVAGTQTYRPGLDLFSAQLSIDAGGQRNIISGDPVIGSALFGPYGDRFPAQEIVVPFQGSLQWTITNRTTSTINVNIAHHALVPVPR